jgi:ubiquinone/menaquinone biosynthesis C-methylase UbiE
MGIYNKLILPRLLNAAMRDPRLTPYRHRTIEAARGMVLEIGVGSGLNLPLYGPAVACIVALDPSPELLRLAHERISDAIVPVSLLQASAEQLPFADAAFDAVIMTWTLCSIPPAAAPDRHASGKGGTSKIDL